MFSVILSWPPSLNHAVVHTRNGMHFRTPAAKAYRALNVITARNARTRCRHTTYEEACAIRIELYPPNRRAFDVDGKVKEVFDVLEFAAVVANDNLLRDLHVVSFDDDIRVDGECHVFVRPIVVRLTGIIGETAAREASS